jgi:hypothetical protein
MWTNDEDEMRRETGSKKYIQEDALKVSLSFLMFDEIASPDDIHRA